MKWSAQFAKTFGIIHGCFGCYLSNGREKQTRREVIVGYVSEVLPVEALDLLELVNVRWPDIVGERTSS